MNKSEIKKIVLATLSYYKVDDYIVEDVDTFVEMIDKDFFNY